MEVQISGRTFAVTMSYTGNRTASAKLRDGVIRIALPSRWPKREKERVSDSLLRRAIRAIETGRWRQDGSAKVAFSHGDVVSAMGREFEILLVPSPRFGSRMEGRRIEIRGDLAHPGAARKVSEIARKRIVDALMPQLEERVRILNERHFKAGISSLTVRDTTSRWGSCSREGDISLSFRLLFMPAEILDYVIVHEIAHTRYRSHGKRFWELVGRAVPDYRERRRWLRENGMDYPKPSPRETESDATGGEPGQMTIRDFVEEPY